MPSLLQTIPEYDEDDFFMARGIEILEGLKKASMTKTFRDYPDQYQSFEWIEIIGHHTESRSSICSRSPILQISSS